MSVDLEPIVEKRVGNTVKSQLGRLIDSKAKSTVDRLLNEKTTKKNDVEDDDFLIDDELEDSDFSLSEEENEAERNVIKTKDGKRLSEEEILKKIEEKDKFDIFSDVGDHWLQKGQVVRYQIDKNNRMLDRVDHPFSWEEVQKKYGAGNYKVIAKLPALNNQYLKSQTKLVAGPPSESPEYVIKDLLDKKESKDSNSGQALSVGEIIALMEKKAEIAESRAEQARREAEERIAQAEERARQDAKERMELQKEMFEKVTMNQKSGGDIIAQLTPLVATLAPLFLKKETKNDNLDMMMKMQEMNMKMFENMQKNTEKMIGSLQESIKSIAESSKTKGDDEFSALKVMKMIKDSENEGFEKYRLMNELARERAEELAELRGDSGGDEKESTVDTLIKSFAPAIATMVTGGGTPMPQPQARPVVMAPQPQQRGNLRQTQPGQARRPVTQGNNGNAVQAVKKEANEQVYQNGQTGNQSGTKAVLDAPKPTGPASFLNSDLESDTPEVTTIVPAQKDTKNVEKIYGIIFPLALNAYTSDSATIDGTALQCVAELENSGVELSTVLRDFDDETLSAILSGTPTEFHEMIRGLHNAIITEIKARN